jgi:hypothetical protein
VTNVERLREMGREAMYTRLEALKAWRAGDEVGGADRPGGSNSESGAGGGGGRELDDRNANIGGSGIGSRERRAARRAAERGEGNEGDAGGGVSS